MVRVRARARIRARVRARAWGHVGVMVRRIVRARATVRPTIWGRVGVGVDPETRPELAWRLRSVARVDGSLWGPGLVMPVGYLLQVKGK